MRPDQTWLECGSVTSPGGAGLARLMPTCASRRPPSASRNNAGGRHYRPNNEDGHQRLIAKLKHLVRHLDLHEHLLPRQLFVGQRIPLAGVAHQNGTLRFGDDPRTSVLDRNCRAHEVDNLYVVDGSSFPSSGAVNPALTIMANALRVGDHIADRLGARARADQLVGSPVRG